MRKNWQKYLIYGLNGGAFFIFLYLLWQMLVFMDASGSAFPHWDDWRFQNNYSFIRMIFALNNENFQLFTNALYWLAPRIGFPFWGLRYVSLLLLLMTMFVLYRLLKKYVSVGRRWLLILAFTPCLSSYMCGNLLWTNLTQVWTYFLLIFWAVYFGFERPQTPKNQFITMLLLMIAFFAMNISLPVVFAGFYIARAFARHRQISEHSFYLQLSIAFIVLMTAFLLYGVIRANDQTEFSLMAVFTAKYWLWLSYGLCGVWSGFLYTADQTWFYYLVGGVMALWLGVLFIRQIPLQKLDTIWAVALILLGGMALLVLFRRELVLAINDHAVRYMAYGIFLIPVIYTIGVVDNNKFIRLTADIWLIVVLICILPAFQKTKYYNSAEFAHIGDVCLMSLMDIDNLPMPVTCGRYFEDVREPYRWFVTHDAAFKQAYRKNPDDAFYHFDGTVFYKIPGKKVLLFR